MNKYLKYILPYGLVRLQQKFEIHKNNKLSPIILETLKNNEQFRDKHKGERCFIVGTGPSLNNQDLFPLKDEIVLALSRFYKHPLYSIIKPKYHIFSGLNKHPKIFDDKDKSFKFYQEAENNIISDVIFTHFRDKKFIDNNNLFQHNQINYYYPSRSINCLDSYEINLNHSIFEYHIITSLALQISLYMGFNEIYLLGFDHTWLKELLNNDIFEHQFYLSHEEKLYHKNHGTFSDLNFDEKFTSLIDWYYNIFRDYNNIEEYAKKKSIRIYNVTSGGLLTMFNRKNYEDIVKGNLK